MRTPTRLPTAGTYLTLGLLAFAVVGWELVLILLEAFIPGLTPVAQWSYYAAVVLVVVMTLIMALGQRAGELRFGRPALPWGGLMLALTWGLVHVLLPGLAAGLYGLLISVAFGSSSWPVAACNGRTCRLSWRSSSEAPRRS